MPVRYHSKIKFLKKKSIAILDLKEGLFLDMLDMLSSCRTFSQTLEIDFLNWFMYPGKYYLIRVIP